MAIILDFRDREAYIKDVEDFNPDYLFHLGAYTDLEFAKKTKMIPMPQTP